MTNDTFDLALMIRRDIPFHDGRESLTVSICQRAPTENGDGFYPRGISDSNLSRWNDDCPKHLRGLALEYLVIDGFTSITASTGERQFIGYTPIYRLPHSVDIDLAQRMIKTLQKLEKGRSGREHIDGMGAVWTMIDLANTLRIKWVVVHDVVEARGRRITEWTFEPLIDGAITYRKMIEHNLSIARPL